MVHIIPDYNFTCHGNVTMWGACVEPGTRDDMYDMHFMVYRPSQNGQCLTLLGKNEASDLNPRGDWGQSCIGFLVPSKQQIRVHPGDVIGLYSLGINGSGVEIDDSNTVATVWSAPVSDFTESFGEVLCFGRNLPSSTPAAPVITFEIGIIPTQLQARCVIIIIPHTLPHPWTTLHAYIILGSRIRAV